jgi:hypothetical protein
MTSQRSLRRLSRVYARDEEWRKNKNGTDYDDPGMRGLTDEKPSTGKRRRRPRRRGGCGVHYTHATIFAATHTARKDRRRVFAPKPVTRYRRKR